MKYILLFCLLTMGNAFAMNKAELIDAMAESAGLSKADAKRAVDGFEKSVEKMLKKREDVTLEGLGTISCKAKERGNRVKCSSNLRLSIEGARPHIKRYIDNFFTTMTSIMANSANNEQYISCDGKDQDCDGPTTRATDHNSSRSNKTSSIMISVGTGLETCYKDGNLYEEVLSKDGRIVAKKRCLGGVLKGLRSSVGDCESCITQEEFEHLSSLARTGMDSFFDIFTEFRDPDSDGDSILVDKVSKYSRLSKADVKRALDGFVNVVSTALKKGDNVKLAGFGSFSVSKRVARTGRNPQTGKEIKIAAKNVIRFKAGSELSDKVN